MKLLGISGTNGAGKDSIGEYLATQRNWLFISVSQILRDELKARKLDSHRKNTSALSAEWRKMFGLGVLIDKALDIYKSQDKEYKGLVVASLRNPGEADEVHRLGGKVIWVDADPGIRYQRIISRQRGSEDQKTYDEFLAEEQHEMHHTGHEATLSLEGVKAKSDIFIENSGEDINAFYASLQKTINP